MFSVHDEGEKALQFILNPNIQFGKTSKPKYDAAFRSLEKFPKYFDFLELNSDDPRLLRNSNALRAYCHYVLTQLSMTHFRFRLILQLIEKHIAPQLKFTEKIIQGEIVDFPSETLHVPIVDLFDYLKQPKKNLAKGWILSSSGEVIFLSDLQFTIFTNKVVFHDADTISELVDATSTTTYDQLTHLIAYRPETILLHQTLIDVSLRVQIKNSDEKDDREVTLMKVVDKVMALAKNDTDKIIKKLYEKRMILENKISDEVNSKKSSDFKHEIAISQTKIKNNHLGKYVTGFTRNHAVIALTLDRLFTNIAEQEISQIINKHIDQLMVSKEILPYQIPEPKNRVLFLVTGGQSSGKSTTVSLYLKTSKINEGLEYIQELSVDILRKKILSHSEIKSFPQELFSAMTQTETAFIVHDKIKKALENFIKQNKSPHFFFEQLFIDQDKINLGLLNGGRVHIIVVSTDIERCIETAFDRGKTTGRYSSFRSMLNGHKESTKQLPDRLLECLCKPVTVEILDNNVLHGKTPQLIAEIDCQKAVIIIYDVEALTKYIRKIALNPKATSLMNLYNNDLEKELTIEKYFEKVNSQYEILYSKENNCRISSYEAPVYSS